MLEITQAIVDAFRTDFEGFADTTAWPNERLARALQRADAETLSSRWGAYSDLSIKQRGMFNFAAHDLTIRKMNSTVTSLGGAPSSMAQVQTKSVGDESVTYAINSQGVKSEDDALKATAYGQEFIRLRRRVGRGGSSSNAVA